MAMGRHRLHGVGGSAVPLDALQGTDAGHPVGLSDDGAGAFHSLQVEGGQPRAVGCDAVP